jgi:hypothetical protein
MHFYNLHGIFPFDIQGQDQGREHLYLHREKLSTWVQCQVLPNVAAAIPWALLAKLQCWCLGIGMQVG